MSRFSFVPGLLGIAMMIGFAARTWLIGGVDDRGTALAIGAATFLLLYAWFDGQTERPAGRARVRQLGGGSIALVLLAGVLAASLHGLVRTFDDTIQLTQDRASAIRPLTHQLIQSLEEPVQIIGFYPHGSPGQRRFLSLTRQMASISDHLTIEAVDPLREPLRAEQFDVTTESGTIVILSGDRTERLVRASSERDLADAIVRVTARKQHQICWSVGHGEAAPDDDQDAAAMSAAVLALESKNYEVTLTRLMVGPPPDTCDVLVIADPKVDLLGHERDSVAGFVAHGGHLLALLEPGSAPSFADDLSRFGLRLTDDVLLDPSPARRMMGRDDPSVFAMGPDARRPHPITRALAGTTVHALTRSVIPENDADGVAVYGLLYTSPRAWAETSLEPPAAPDPEEQAGEIPLVVAVEIQHPDRLEGGRPPRLPPALDTEEIAGRVKEIIEIVRGAPLTAEDDQTLLSDLGLDVDQVATIQRGVATELGLPSGRLLLRPSDAVETLVTRATAELREQMLSASATDVSPTAPTAGGRMVVIGDSSFATNRYLDVGSNLQLFTASIAWLVQEQDQLAPEPPLQSDKLEITAWAEGWLCFYSVFFLPSLAGFFAWRARRRQAQK